MVEGVGRGPRWPCRATQRPSRGRSRPRLDAWHPCTGAMRSRRATQKVSLGRARCAAPPRVGVRNCELRRKGNGRRCRQGPKVAVPSDSKAQPIYIGHHSTTPDLCHSFTCVQDKSNQSLERMDSPKEQRCENNKQVIGQREGRNLCTPRKTQGLPSSLVGSGHAVGEETAIVSGATARAPSSFPSLLDIEWTSIGPLLDLY